MSGDRVLNLKEKLKDAHENFPIIDNHPGDLYEDALNRIVTLEMTLKSIRQVLSTKDADCLGSGNNGQIEWPIRDEIIDHITKIIEN